MCVLGLVAKLIFKDKKKKFIVLEAVLSVILTLVLVAGLYFSDYNRADARCSDYLVSSGTVEVTKTGCGYLFDGSGEKDLIIFYPGAKVEAKAYAPLLYRLAEAGYDAVLVEMPFNFAILGQNKADDIISNYSYENYYMAGHSLGGAMASIYTNKHENIKGLILLAAYSTKEIDVPVLSVYGSEDGVLNKETYTKSKGNLKNIEEHIIDGANHSGFAYYNQSGDHISLITADEQIGITVKYIDDFLGN